MLLPGILLSNSSTDYGAFHALQLARFDGKRWVAVSDMIATDNIKQG